MISVGKLQFHRQTVPENFYVHINIINIIKFPHFPICSLWLNVYLRLGNSRNINHFSEVIIINNLLFQHNH